MTTLPDANLSIELQLKPEKFLRKVRELRRGLQKTPTAIAVQPLIQAKAAGTAALPKFDAKAAIEKVNRVVGAARLAADELDKSIRARRTVSSAKNILGVDVGGFDQVGQTAAAANLGLEQTADLLVELGAASKSLRLKPAQINGLVTSIAELLRIGGSDVGKIRAAFTDLARSLSGGTLDGGEFVAFLKEARFVRKALADELGASDPRQLFELVAASNVGIEQLVAAVANTDASRRDLDKPRFKTVEEAKDTATTLAVNTATNAALADAAIDLIDVTQQAPRSNKATKSGLETGTPPFGETVVPRSDPIDSGSTETLLKSLLRQLLQTTGRVSPSADLSSTSSTQAPQSGINDVQFDTGQREQMLRRLLQLLSEQTRLTREQTSATSDYVSREQTSQDLLARQLSTLRGGFRSRKRQLSKPATSPEATANSQPGSTAPLPRSRHLQELSRFDSVAKDSLRGFINELRQGKTSTEALLSVLGSIEDRLIDITLNALFSGAGSGCVRIKGANVMAFT